MLRLLINLMILILLLFSAAFSKIEEAGNLLHIDDFLKQYKEDTSALLFYDTSLNGGFFPKLLSIFDISNV